MGFDYDLQFHFESTRSCANKVVLLFAEDSKGEQQDSKCAGKEVVPYVGPTPPIGIHRYIFVLYRQPSEQPLLVTPPPMRNNFNTRKFAVEHGLGLPVAATYFNAAKEPGTRRR